MTVTVANAAMGPGTLYIATFGVTEPLDTAVNTAPAASAFTDVGGTLGGLALSFAEEFAELEYDQVPIKIGSRRTKLVVQAKVKIAEVTLDNLVYALNGGTTATGSGYKSYVPSMVDSSVDPTYKAILFDGYGPNAKRRRVILRRVLNTDTVEIEHTKDGQQAFQCTFDCHYVSSAIEPYKIIDAV